jgi:hypothetical protein
MKTSLNDIERYKTNQTKNNKLNKAKLEKTNKKYKRGRNISETKRGVKHIEAK